MRRADTEQKESINGVLFLFYWMERMHRLSPRSVP